MRMKLALLVLVLVSTVQAKAPSTLAECTEFTKRWFQALSLGTRDLDTAITDLLDTYYDDEATLIDPNFKTPQKGRKAVEAYYRAVMAKYPNWAFKIAKIYPTAEGFVLHYEGSVPGVVDAFYGIDILEFNSDGKITKLVEGYDRTPFLKP